MIDKPLLKHQTQPCPTSCVTTCIAILAGADVKEVIPIIHEKIRAMEISLRDAMTMASVDFKSFDTCDLVRLNMQGAYLVGVPSLHIVGGTHQIIIELTETDYHVVDPCKGRIGCKYYVKRGCADDSGIEIEINSFDVDAFVSRSWLQSRPKV